MSTVGKVLNCVVLLGVFAAMDASAEIAIKSGYKLDSNVLCDGYPRIPVSTPENICVGLMLSKNEGLKMPRYAVQSVEGITYISEMGGWAFGKGTIYAYYEATEANGKKRPALVNLFPNQKLTMPNGLLLDPEGRLYVGLPTGVFRFQPRDSISGKFNLDPTLEPVFTDIAASIFRKEEYTGASAYNGMDSRNKNKHPLLQIAANKNFSEIFVNVGAPSDDCASGLKTLDQNGKCIQTESTLASAAVWKVVLSNDVNRKTISAQPFARGLRNSMALAVHGSGTVMQGENGIDLPDENLPFEELNQLEEGRHYGWPYCHSEGKVAPEFAGKVSAEDCLKKYTLPKVFMPAHTAPLSMLYYNHGLLPSIQGQLLVAWHGYQEYGHRVVAYPIDAKGVPSSNQYKELVFGWQAQEGVRPRGAPTGLAQMKDGSILVIDDKNGAVLRISKGAAAVVRPQAPLGQEFSEESIRAFEPLVPFVKQYCASCHAQFKKANAPEILKGIKASMLDMHEPLQSSLYMKMKSRQMPPPAVRKRLKFSDQEYEVVTPQIEKFLRTLKP